MPLPCSSYAGDTHTSCRHCTCSQPELPQGTINVGTLANADIDAVGLSLAGGSGLTTAAPASKGAPQEKCPCT